MSKQTDYLIIGAGVAGLVTAYHLSEFGKVTVLTKGELKNANTYWAQGGIAAVMDKADSFESHIDDTMKAGAGHCRAAAVRHLVFGAPKAMRFLESLGLHFDKVPVLEAGHSHARVWRTSDFTGQDIMNTLIKVVSKKKNVEIFENEEVVELIVSQGECLGAFVRDTETNEIQGVAARQTILATGGCGQLFAKSTNTKGSGGDGLALAVNAGLELSDMEFMQFHPTAYAVAEDGRHFLLSEALRGAGAKIVNQHGLDFLKKFDTRGELAPRDLVARAVYVEELNGPVYLDMRHLDQKELHQRFPNIIGALKEKGLDPAKDLVPITPAAHYACGGVPVDLSGATQLPGLYAVGEVACTGVHGANRLASNSLLESIVFAKAVADSMEKSLSMDQSRNVNIDSMPVPTVVLEDMSQVKVYGKRLADIMWENVGIVRTKEGLEKARKDIVSIPARDYRVQHRQLVCYKIIEACLAREDSLGTHYMSEEIV